MNSNNVIKEPVLNISEKIIEQINKKLENIKEKIKLIPDIPVMLPDEPNPIYILPSGSPLPCKVLMTEDLGKKFEMAICMLYEIPFDGSYKYSMEDATKLSTRIRPFRELFNHNLIHVAKGGNKYDFDVIGVEGLHLSAKTSKKDGKVCPQVIGQPSKKKFCSHFNLSETITLEEIKVYITDNLFDMLPIYFNNTFECPILYYNKNKNLCLFIVNERPIDWRTYIIEFSHLKKNKSWGESSTISINNITIGEFQVHNHRDCIKFRWAFENILKVFNSNFKIIEV